MSCRQATASRVLERKGGWGGMGQAHAAEDSRQPQPAFIKARIAASANICLSSLSIGSFIASPFSQPLPTSSPTARHPQVVRMADSSDSDSDRGPPPPLPPPRWVPPLPSPPPPSEFAPNYSDDDIKGFIKATNLCDSCCIMFGPQENWTPLGEGENDCKHHDSREALCRCVQDSECRICIILLRYINDHSADTRPLSRVIDERSSEDIAVRDLEARFSFSMHDDRIRLRFWRNNDDLWLNLYDCALSQADITVCAPFAARSATGVFEGLLIKCRQ